MDITCLPDQVQTYHLDILIDAFSDEREFCHFLFAFAEKGDLSHEIEDKGQDILDHLSQFLDRYNLVLGKMIKLKREKGCVKDWQVQKPLLYNMLKKVCSGWSVLYLASVLIALNKIDLARHMCHKTTERYLNELAPASSINH